MILWILLTAWKPWSPKIMSKTNLLAPLRVMVVSAIKIPSKLWGFHKKRLVRSRAMLYFVVSKLHLCPTYLWSEFTTGTNRITLRGTFSTSHFDVWAFFLRKQSDFAFLEVRNPSEINVFHENSACQTFHSCNHVSMSDFPQLQPNLHIWISSCDRFCGVKTTSASGPPLIWICHWHQQNYSTRYLLYESLEELINLFA